MTEGFRQGWHTGYPLGQSEGHHLGSCETVIRSNQRNEPLPTRQWRILFVVSGQGDPYATIERGLLLSLHELVAELRVVTPFDDVAEIAQTMKPDLVLVFNGMDYVSTETIQLLRQRGHRTAVWFTDDPYYADLSGGIALNYDIVFTQELSCVEYYRGLGCPKVHFIPLAVSTHSYKPQRVASEFHNEICFLGSGYRNRIALFDAIAPLLASKKTLIAGRWWERLEQYSLLQPFIRGDAAWLTSEDTVNCYAGAKIVINCHRAFDDDEINANQRRIPALTPNPRTFEIGAVGTLQLVDAREGLATFYTPGEEIETFASPEELAHKIEYYLQHEEQRRRIALKGLARTVREHTYSSRLQELLHAAFLS
ncbi:glycosyltransferase [Paenibacillus sp. 1_12]|uniref:CgeB family protein n=1 Tax=Paenibacillus sp. 1_12 TaxID=1566278 RepID=UPI000B818AA0|nr:glycosyltransferase [Paenibacillus sp. 1_12]